MIYFDKQEERNEKLRKLNTCYPGSLQWEGRKAQKKHIDLFGKEIQEGEIYFRLHIDPDYGDDLKLSETSLDSFLYAIFAPHPIWEQAAEEIIQHRTKKIRGIINNLRGSIGD